MKKLLSALLLTIPTLALANNQLLVLSGGGYPWSNHYSQYLQTKAVYTDLSTRMPFQVDVFFGAGNTPNSPAEFADVHKTEKNGELKFSRYLVGAIQNNHAATKENVIHFFNTQVQPELETFFMVVSDHGVPNLVNGNRDETFSNNCIDLWNAKLEGDHIADIGSFETTRCFSKNELRDSLNSKVPAKRKVFAMSQCFSGGFHQMSVSEVNNEPVADPSVCGFTAVTHDTWASGCSPDVDGPSYQGYERSFTEQLTGIDYVNNRKLREPKNSFQAAHQAAILEDMTVDIPLATSDYFLWQWALKLKHSSEIFKDAANYNHNVNNPKFLNKKFLFRRMHSIITEKFPAMKEDLDLPIDALENRVTQLSFEMKEIESHLVELGRQSDDLFYEHAIKLWLSDFDSGATLDLTADELELEKFIQSHGGSGQVKNTFAPVMATHAEEKAIQLTQFIASRTSKVEQYVLSHGPALNIENTLKVMAMNQDMNLLDEKLNELGKRHGLTRRMLIYRQILGAWAVLDSSNNSQALDSLSDLIDCEGTPLI